MMWRQRCYQREKTRLDPIQQEVHLTANILQDFSFGRLQYMSSLNVVFPNWLSW